MLNNEDKKRRKKNKQAKGRTDKKTNRHTNKQGPTGRVFSISGGFKSGIDKNVG